MLNSTIKSNNLKTLKFILITFWVKLIFKLKNINVYYLRNENLWLDGFLFDFLQKKTADIWIRKFVVYTGFMFSERLVFDTIVKLYIDYFVWYSHKFTIFEVNNVFEMLNNLLYLIITIFFIIMVMVIIL